MVRPMLTPELPETQTATARALQLVERYGVLTREAALGEGIEGGFAGVYPVLKALEERGDIRRGYFVEGLGAAQFALPGAVDRLRSMSGDDVSPTVLALAAVDPAQPYGASVRWPDSGGRPARSAGAFVVLVDGAPAVYLERGGRSLLGFEAAFESDRWVEPLVELISSGHVKKLEIAKIDGEPASASPLAKTLAAHGFVKAYKGYTWVPKR